MRVAFLTYEYPPETAYGGIATYTQNAAMLVATAGEKAVVFCPSPKGETRTIQGNPEVVYIKAQDESEFRSKLPAILGNYLKENQIDVIESCDYAHPHSEISDPMVLKKVVVRLHTPMFLALRISGFEKAPKRLRLKKAVKSLIGGNLGEVIESLNNYHKSKDPEFIATRKASAIVSPSLSLVQKLRKYKWLHVNPSILPNPICINPALMEIRPVRNIEDGFITYIGRLEERKGVFEFARAIAILLNSYPDLKFRFVGSDLEGSHGKSNKLELKALLADHLDSIEFAGKVPPEQLPFCLSQASICVFPSRWENFPYVCLEAMMAAKAIVASSAGGMGEMIQHCKSGLLIPPGNANAIAKAIASFTIHPERLAQYGLEARKQVTSRFTNDALQSNYINYYKQFARERQLASPD